MDCAGGGSVLGESLQRKYVSFSVSVKMTLNIIDVMNILETKYSVRLM